MTPHSFDELQTLELILKVIMMLNLDKYVKSRKYLMIKNYLLSLTSAHINFDTQRAATQYSKVEFINLHN